MPCCACRNDPVLRSGGCEEGNSAQQYVFRSRQFREGQLSQPGRKRGYAGIHLLGLLRRMRLEAIRTTTRVNSRNSSSIQLPCPGLSPPAIRRQCIGFARAQQCGYRACPAAVHDHMRHSFLLRVYRLRAEVGLISRTIAARACTGDRSAAGHLLQPFGIPGPLHRDLGGGGLDVAQVARCELDRGRARGSPPGD